jgi:Fungalysin/Thermolysin Propeptide Motif/Thermolysin metallopeptidase, alpha-helical domain
MRRSIAVFAVAVVTVGLLSPSVGARPQQGLALQRVLHSLTGTHQWYVQTHGGHPVLGSFFARHLDRTGRVVSIQDGRLTVGGSVASAASLGREAALRAAGTSRGEAVLSVQPGARARLVWAVYGDDGYRTLVDATTGAVVGRALAIKEATGSGKVFDPNPVVTLQDESLTDQKDRDYAALQPAYFVRDLRHLDGTGVLRGDFADVTGNKSRAESPTLDFIYDRSQTEFEQVMAYYHVTVAQEYIQSIGFTDINNEPQDVKANQWGIDNSAYYPQQDFMRFGKGGVDDAEDAEVIWHEYGHAIQDSQVPFFGEGHDAGSIGEGFSDYWAVTMSVPVSGGFELPCVADWDSVSYTSDVPHCLRRTDLDLTVDDQTGRIHHDGQIWSRALWDIHKALGRNVANRIILEAQYFFSPTTSFRDAALETVEAALQLYGLGAAAVVHQSFEDRGIL